MDREARAGIMQAGAVIRHSQFGPAMPSLNWIPAPRYVLRRDRVLELLKNIAPCRVLDIGCGPGALISELAARGFDAVGVDRSAMAQEIGKQLQSQSPGMTIQPRLDETWKGSFDIVMSFEVIEHIEDDVGAMREWREYLKPAGRMLISTPAHPGNWNAADEWAGHVRRYDREGLVRAVEAAGFAVEKVECYGFPLANVMEKLTAPTYRRKLREKTDSSTNAHTLTDDSGSDRSTHTRYWRIYSSMLPVAAMKLLCLLQRPFLKTDFGTGFIVIARAV